MKHLPELRTVQCFATVVREGNVTRAAEVLHLSQPAVTQQLKNLSERSGLTLFTRTAKGLALTPDGAILEPSMLAMVRSGVGLSLCRDSIALNERQTRGMVISDTVEVSTTLEFICLNARRQDPVISTTYDILLQIWE